MARSIDNINNEILAAIAAEPLLAGLTNTSFTSVFRTFTFIIATAIWTLEVIQDDFIATVLAYLESLVPHTLRWYVKQTKAFQLGYTLIDSTGKYATIDAAAQIVKEAAAVELTDVLQIKANKEVSGELVPLAPAEYIALDDYLREIKDAGVKVELISADGDDLKQELTIYYDPQVLDANGARLDGTATTPVLDAIKAYIKAMVFNSRFTLLHYVDYLQKIDGVIIPQLQSTFARKHGSVNYATVNVEYQPYSGYLKIYNPNDVTINYVPYV